MRELMNGVLAALLAASPAFAQDEAALAARASERGRAMYAYDRAAWLGTDDMLTKLPDPGSKVAGYIVEGSPEAPRLIFFDKAAIPRAVYVASFAGGKLVKGKVLGDGDDRTIAPEIRRMIAALATAREAMIASPDSRPCAKAPFNSLVIPPASTGAPVSVYFLTPQTDAGSIPFGGHFAIDVAAAGVAGPIRRFTKTCLNVASKPPPGSKQVSVGVSQLIGNVPTEIHVFSSLSMRLPVMVITPTAKPRVWQVVGDRIGAPQDLKK